MAGLINQAAQEELPEGAPEEELPEEGVPEEEVPEEGAPAPKGGNQITPEKVRAGTKMPANLKQAYDRVVLAGMKVMFSEETHEMASKVLEGDGPVESRLANGIAALMGTLVQQSNNTMPPQVVIPAGVELLVSAADYLNESGVEPVNDQQIGEAMAQFVQLILDQVGAGAPEQLQQMLQQSGGGMPAGGAQSGTAPPVGGAQPSPAPAPRGLVKSQMNTQQEA